MFESYYKFLLLMVLHQFLLQARKVDTNVRINSFLLVYLQKLYANHLRSKGNIPINMPINLIAYLLYMYVFVSLYISTSIFVCRSSNWIVYFHEFPALLPKLLASCSFFHELHELRFQITSTFCCKVIDNIL